MIKNSPKLQVILLIDMAALLLYNISGMMVTSHIGAVFRTVLETMRTLFVWLVGVEARAARSTNTEPCPRFIPAPLCCPFPPG
jgi:hypothetical protein